MRLAKPVGKAAHVEKRGAILQSSRPLVDASRSTSGSLCWLTQLMIDANFGLDDYTYLYEEAFSHLMAVERVHAAPVATPPSPLTPPARAVAPSVSFTFEG